MMWYLNDTRMRIGCENELLIELALFNAVKWYNNEDC